jgi:regulator of replication initiation timing
MDTFNQIEERVAELYSKIDDIHSELYTLGAAEERLDFFEKLRELISEKIAANDEIAADVLGWAYERLALDSYLDRD